MSELEKEANQKEINEVKKDVRLWIKTTLYIALFYTIIALIVSIF